MCRPCVMLLAIVVGIAPGTVLAEEAFALDCPDRPGSIAQARKLAGTLFTEATRAFDQQRFKDALRRFLCSMTIIEHENTLINIQKTARETVDKAAAVPLLRGYVSKVPDGKFTPQINEILDVMEAELQAETEEVNEPEPQPAPVIVKPPKAPDPPAEEVAATDNRFKHALEVSGWTNVTLGAGTFIAAIAFQGLAASARNKAEEATRYDELLHQRERNKAFQVGATSTFVASALFAGLGIAQLVLAREKDGEAADGPEVSFAPGVGWLGLKGTF